MRVPIHTGDLFGVKLYFLVERAAYRVEHAALDGAAQRLGVDNQSAVVRADQTLHPNVTGFAIHLDRGDGARPLEPVVIGGAGSEESQAKLDRVGFRRRRQFVNERFGREGYLWTIGIPQV